MMRAIRQYTDALQYWRDGHELYALSHLYMGVEAITNSIRDREILRRGLKGRSELPRLGNDKYPESWVRCELIFRGDRETYRKRSIFHSPAAVRACCPGYRRSGV
jgi:hypothetical protein